MATVSIKESGNDTSERTRPPFLRRVRIRGYKSIAFCDIRLQPLTILVGRNAAGKSNFLDALAFLRDVMKVGVVDAVKINAHGGWPSLLCRSSDAQKIEIQIETAFTCGWPFRKISDNHGPYLPPDKGPLPDLSGVSFTATYSLEFSTGPHSAPVISRESVDIADETGRLSGGFAVHDGIVEQWGTEPGFSHALGHPKERRFPLMHRPDFPLLSVIGTQPFVDLGEGFRWMGFYNFVPDSMRGLPMPTAGSLLDKHGQNLASVIEGLKEAEPETVQRVRDYLSVITPEIDGFEVIRHGEYETVHFRLRGEDGQKPIEFDAASMSDGTLRALAALVAAFQVVLPRGYPSVVGIEEPEVALHPAAMRALVDGLDDATQRTQVILTTHSADLLSGRDITPGQVLVVRSRRRQTHITPVGPAGREIIEKELYSLAELQRMDKLDLDEADLKRQDRLIRVEEI
jgi:predicted ATPase